MMSCRRQMICVGLRYLFHCLHLKPAKPVYHTATPAPPITTTATTTIRSDWKPERWKVASKAGTVASILLTTRWLCFSVSGNHIWVQKRSRFTRSQQLLRWGWRTIIRIGTFKHALSNQGVRTRLSQFREFEAMLQQRKRSFTIKVSRGRSRWRRRRRVGVFFFSFKGPLSFQINHNFHSNSSKAARWPTAICGFGARREVILLKKKLSHHQRKNSNALLFPPGWTAGWTAPFHSIHL